MSERIEDVDEDEIDDETYADDQDDDDSPAIQAHSPIVLPPMHFVLEEGGRHVEAYLFRDGSGVRMEWTETFACSGVAEDEIEERLRETLLARGYKKD